MAEKRVAVVTGGNKGIGFEICKKLAAQGITVVLTARDENKGNEAVDKIKDSGLSENVIFHQLDVMDPVSMVRLVDFIRSKFGKLDILVNNAGTSGVSTEGDHASIMYEMIVAHDYKTAGREAHEMKADAKPIQTFELAEECLKTNYYGVKQLTKALIPLLQQSLSPRIVNLSSFLGKIEFLSNEWAVKVLSDAESLTEDKLDEVAAEFLKDFEEGALETKGWPSLFTAYKVSKACLNGYTRFLAKKYPSFCINSVCPGFCKTDMNANTGMQTSEEGAEGPVKLALLPHGSPSGCYYLRMGSVPLFEEK